MTKPKPKDGQNPPPKRMGRPPALSKEKRADVLKTLEGLGAIMATKEEAAAVLGMAKSTLYRYFETDPELKEAFENGPSKGKASLRRTLFQMAPKNASVAIHLSMNYLGLKSRTEISGNKAEPVVHKHTGTVEAKVKHDYSGLSPDELRKRLEEKIRPAGGTGG